MASRRRSRPLQSRVYVGQLENDATHQELEEAFSCFGPVKSVWIARNPPGFAFVEFEDPRNAQEAVRVLDGSLLCGHSVKVAFADRNSRSSSRPLFQDSSQVICYTCGERGHYARDCSVQDSASSDSEERCYACGEEGHYASDCLLQHYQERCYTCGERGHYARDCSVQDSSSTDSGERCYACGEEGHYARDCLVRHYQERCYACGERGHYARNCIQASTSLDRENQSDQQVTPGTSDSHIRAYGGNNSRSQQQDRNSRSQQQARSNRHQEQYTTDGSREQYRIDRHQNRSTNISMQSSLNSASNIPSTSSDSNKHNATSADVKCAICLDTVEDRMEYIPCGHGFHAKCCKDWLSIKGACPVCRTRVESRNGNTPNRRQGQLEDDGSNNGHVYYISSVWLA